MYFVGFFFFNETHLISVSLKADVLPRYQMVRKDIHTSVIISMGSSIGCLYEDFLKSEQQVIKMQ